jgi:hypothetical protein
VIVAGVAASGSFAYWSAGGSGAGSGGTISNPDPLTILPATPTSTLVPGDTGDVAVTVTNPNSFRIHVNSFELAPGGYSPSTCELTYTTQTNGGLGWDIPKKVAGVDGSSTIHLGGALAMSSTAPSECQGADIKVYLQVGP